MQIITLKIGSASTGRDFADPMLAHASTPNDWVAADVQYIYEFYNDSEFVATKPWNFGGKTMDPSHGLIVRAAAGQGFKDNPNILTNALRYNQANGVAVKFALDYSQHITIVDNVTVEGLQIRSSGLGSVVAVGSSGAVGNSSVNNCLVEFAGNSSLARAVVVGSGVVKNSYVILTGATSTGIFSGAAVAENVTVVRLPNLPTATKPAFDGNSASFKITNCAAFGCSAFSTRSDFTGSNNASDGSILFGTNNKTNLVYADQFVDTINDFRVKAGSALIDAGTTPSSANTLTITGVRQQGGAVDIGAWENPSSIQAPTATVTNISITNQNVIITGTTTGNPTSGTASLGVVAMPYNQGVAQGPANLTLGNGTFAVAFNAVKAGRYSLIFSVANANYSISGSNPFGSIDVVGPRALSLIQDDVTSDQILSIHGTVEKATSGQVVIPASASNSTLASKTLPVSIDTSTTPNTFTVSAALPSGNYDAPILTFTGSGGTSLPQAGTQAIVVVGPRALTVVQDPVDGQKLTIHGTVEKSTSGQLVVPVAATNPNGAIEQSASVTIDASANPDTYTVTVTLPAGNYGVPVLTFSNYLGQSTAQAGTSAVSIMSFNGSPQADMSTSGTVTDTTAPQMVGTLAVSNVSTTGYTVTWQAATDDSGVAYYEVATDGISYSSVGSSLTYSTTSANPSSTYNVKVRAVDTSSNRSAPLSATVVTLAATDSSAPVLTGTIIVSNISSTGFMFAWQAATDNVGVTGYEYSLSGGAYVDVGRNLSASVTGLSASTAYDVSVRAYDTVGNRSAAITTTVKTASYVPSNGFIPSVARTIDVLAVSPVFTGGKWWNLSDSKRPRGAKDPDATIDITFDWADWLSDIGSVNISDVVFTLNGVSSGGTFSNGTQATVFISGGTAGSAASVACKIKTFTNPPRTDERTVYIDIAEA